ncbi:MAG: tetratricopeptide repeat protein, partial [Prochlorothrix sp.]
IDRYATQLQTLITTEGKPDPTTILTVLYGRDTLQSIVESGERLNEAEITRILALDRQLKAQATVITTTIHLPDYRALLPQADRADRWWWHLEAHRPPHRFDQLDWLWKGLTLTCWPFNLALIVDIGQRFLSGGVGIEGVLAVVAPTLLALLQANSELTETGQAAFEKFLLRLNIPPQWREEAKFASSSLLLAGLLLFSSSLPRLSQDFNRKALKASEQGNLALAEQKFKQAIALDPDNAEAHYNLGELYERLQKRSLAEEQYQIAAQSQIPQAYNNLGELSIQDQKYLQAVAWLEQGLIYAQAESSRQSLENSPGNSPIDPDRSILNPDTTSPAWVRYGLLKNLGWARYEQGRYPEAEQHLRDAIAILETTPETAQERFENRGSSYCLLAQTLKAESRHTFEREVAIDAVPPQDPPPPPAESLKLWELCNTLAQSTDFNEDSWKYMAQEELEGQNAP